MSAAATDLPSCCHFLTPADGAPGVLTLAGFGEERSGALPRRRGPSHLCHGRRLRLLIQQRSCTYLHHRTAIKETH